MESSSGFILYRTSDSHRSSPNQNRIYQTIKPACMVVGSRAGLSQTVFKYGSGIGLPDQMVSLAQTISRFGSNCTAINSRRPFRAYKPKQTGSLNYFESIANRAGPNSANTITPPNAFLMLY